MHRISKETILQEAQRIIHGARNADYGHPFLDFSRTAGMLNALFKHKLAEGSAITPQDVATIMICVKLSRLVNKPKRDNLVDIAGYAGTIEMVEQYKSK